MTERKSPSSQNMRHRLIKVGTVLLLVGSGLQMPSTLSHETTAIAQTDTADDLVVLREKADKSVKALQYLNTDYKNEFLSLIRQYDTSSKNIEEIMKEAEVANRLAHDAETDNESQPQLDTIDEKINALKEKVDESQRKLTDTHDKAMSTEKSVEEGKTTEESAKVKHRQSSTPTIAALNHGQQDHSALKDDVKKDLEALKDKHEATENGLLPLQDTDSAVTRIDHFVSDSLNDKTNHYFEDKLQHLQSFEQEIKNRTDISGAEKTALLNDAKTVTHQLNAQNDTILTQLKDQKDKRAAVESILGEVFNKQEAAKRAKRIDVKGKTDQQLADEIHRQADRLKKTSSDDLLLGMLENTSNSQGLVESILRTRFDEQKAQKLAEEIVQDKPSNQVILERLKGHFKTNGKASGDDILSALINNTDPDSKVMESILGGRLNAENAKLIADRVQQDKKSAHQKLKSIEDELSAQANRLLILREQLQHARKNAKTNINDLFAPLRRIASILRDGLNSDGIKSSGRTNDKLQQLLNRDQQSWHRDGGLFKHDFAPKPDIDPYRVINSQTTSHGFLDGLFDQDGNFNLPNTGQIVKYTWLPFGILVVAVGALILLLRFHKKAHRS